MVLKITDSTGVTRVKDTKYIGIDRSPVQVVPNTLTCNDPGFLVVDGYDTRLLIPFLVLDEHTVTRIEDKRLISR
jgi:hypothetical protein